MVVDVFTLVGWCRGVPTVRVLFIFTLMRVEEVRQMFLDGI